MRKDYDQHVFWKLDPGNSYSWKWVPSIGKFGGILCGVKNDYLDVNAVKIGRFMIQFVLWDKREIVIGALLWFTERHKMS
jgi:hypothetical protein